MKKQNRQLKKIILTILILLCALSAPGKASAAARPGRIAFLKAVTTDSTKGISEKEKSKGYRKVELSWMAAKGANKYKVVYSFKKAGLYKRATKEPFIKGSKAGRWRKCLLAYPKNKKVFFKVIPYRNSAKGKASDWAAVRVANKKENASRIIFKKYYRTVYVGGERGRFTAKADRGFNRKVRWKSSDPSIATVGQNTGLVKGLKKGKVRIYAIAHNGVRKYITVKVKASGTSRVNGIPSAPTLKYVTLRPQNEGDTKAMTTIHWSAIKGEKYQILRKTSGSSYGVIATVKATSAEPAYVDKTGNVSTRYTYSVRMIEKNGTYTVKGKYDTAGIRTLPALKDLSVDFQNLKADLTWKQVSGASSYTIYRKAYLSGTYRKLGEASDGKYTDVYRDSSLDNNDKQYLCDKYFVDPSVNPFVYQVRANSSSTDSNGNKKFSYSYYNKDGFFELVPTAIVRFDFDEGSKSKGTLFWSPVSRAEGYIIRKSKDGKKWTQIHTMKKRSGASPQSEMIPYDAAYPYYSVTAYSHRNGKKIYGGCDEGFYVKREKEYANKRVLFLGNSITYGSPYKGKTTRHIYSYPYRVGQLLGIDYFNPSIPGSTYSYKEKQKSLTSYRRYRIYEEVALPIATGHWPSVQEAFPNDPRSQGDEGDPLRSSRDWFENDLHVTLPTAENYKDYTYDNYDVVIMAAGTNDYGDSAPFVDENGDITNTETTNMTGAVNSIVNLIKEGSEKRVAAGKEPIKLVMLDFFYSDRLYYYYKRQNRDVTQNDKGYTLTDYQNQMNKIINRYEEIYDGQDDNNEAENILDIYHFRTRDYGFVTEENCPYTSSDNLHMNRFTYTQIGNAMAAYLKETVFK